MLAYKDGRNVRLESRNGVNHTRRLPELAAVAGSGGSTLLGEAPTYMPAKKARAMFPALADDRAARAEFREMLRGVAMASGK
jgi:ATP-dependent DNA ligase